MELKIRVVEFRGKTGSWSDEKRLWRVELVNGKGQVKKLNTQVSSYMGDDRFRRPEDAMSLAESWSEFLDAPIVKMKERNIVKKELVED